jgi:hypothetical protein
MTAGVSEWVTELLAGAGSLTAAWLGVLATGAVLGTGAVITGLPLGLNVVVSKSIQIWTSLTPPSGSSARAVIRISCPAAAITGGSALVIHALRRG